MTDWEEIKRLAADFQRTQESDTLQRISERNCIDIVKKLTELNLIELIYTCDGKEFITPSHLLKEIEDEVYVNKGRVHLHDLAATLNVDYQHIENRTKELIRDKPDEYNLILGQIIHSQYKSTLGKQIYDNMIANGQLSIADFAKTLDLPTEFLFAMVKEILPSVMQDFVASSDGRTYYTTDMMDRYRAIIAGCLTAISKPTTIASVIKRLDIAERMFTPIVETLIKEGRLDATIENRIYIPSIYAREQNEWINKFYSANSYIEYDVLSRKDIKQPKAFLRKRFPEGIPLKTCFVHPTLVSQVESLVEDCIASSSAIDISSILPPSIQAEDIEQILQDIFKKNKQFSTSCSVIKQTNICSLGYIATCKKVFHGLMDERAQIHLREGKLMNHFLGGKVKDEASQRKHRNSEQTKDAAEAQARKEIENTNVQEADQENRAKDQKEVAGGPKGVPKSKEQMDAIEMTPEDLKREKRNKKGKVDVAEPQDSDDDQSAKKSKSRKSGGGAQGREIKQKSVKKKYLPGNKGQRNRDDSDDEAPTSTSKTPRSNKGRAARRAESPEPTPSTVAKSRSGTSQPAPKEPERKEPLVFMETEEIIEKLKQETHEFGEFSDEMFESVANMLEADLCKAYEIVAKQTLDSHLKSQGAVKNDENSVNDEDDDIDVIE